MVGDFNPLCELLRMFLALSSHFLTPSYQFSPTFIFALRESFDKIQSPSIPPRTIYNTVVHSALPSKNSPIMIEGMYIR